MPAPGSPVQIVGKLHVAEPGDGEDALHLQPPLDGVAHPHWLSRSQARIKEIRRSKIRDVTSTTGLYLARWPGGPWRELRIGGFSNLGTGLAP